MAPLPESISRDSQDEHDSAEENASACDHRVSVEEGYSKPGVATCRAMLVKAIHQYEFPLLIVAAIGLAKAYPPLGARYLQPQYTASWLAVDLIFFLSGWSLRTRELSQAAGRIYYNSFVQAFNFGLVSVIVYLVTQLLLLAQAMNAALADGMVICACLPMAINVVIVLSAAVGADEGAAVFNTTVGNMLGIVLSPFLILGYLGSKSSVSLGQVFLKLALRVVLPLMIGQFLQLTSQAARDFSKAHKRAFKKVQEYCLVFIVYTVFCKTFESNSGAGIRDVMIMIAVQFVIIVSLMVVAWYTLEFFFPDEPELLVTGVYGCVFKTVALGIPLISSMYEADPKIGLYSLPILVWHPMQLVLGSLLVPRFSKYIESARRQIKARERDVERTISADVENQVDDHEGAPTFDEKAASM